MLCDVCNTRISDGEEEHITPEVFSFLLDNGFGIHESNIRMLTETGIPRHDAEESLKRTYRQSSSDWLLCTQCVARAKAILAVENERWVTTNYIAVTQTAEEVGMGFDIIGAPVALSRDVWNECVKWTDQDSELQEYQEQDARLWDVLFTGGGTLQIKVNQFLARGFHNYSVVCIPRDGTSHGAIKVPLLIRQEEICDKAWLVIEKAGKAVSVDD
ncbi:MAG: hypothetical protein CV087_12385 [Candidatus Brocadia sp. WS118]|nr:MAG: hypothetical protein CV087_12385 [Candidatus Brocadia sp. WS118]